MTPQGNITGEFTTPPTPTPPAPSNPSLNVVGNSAGAITAGPGASLWFTDAAGNRIGRITPGANNAQTQASVQMFTIPTPNAQPNDLTAGPDGNLWFTESGANKIGRITPAGVISQFPIPTANAVPAGIAAGPDGNLWFTEYNASAIGRITPAGVISQYTLPTPVAQPLNIAAGPDGAMWFTEPGANKTGRISPDASPSPPQNCIPEAPLAPGGGPWKPVAPMCIPRYAFGAATGPDGRIYAVGGETSIATSPNGGTSGPLASVEAYTPATNTWAPVAPLPAPRSGLAVVTGPDRRIYAMGGDSAGTVDAYDTKTNTWTALASLPVPVTNLAAATSGGLIYAIGGDPASSNAAIGSLTGVNTGPSAIVQAYDPATNTWSLPCDTSTCPPGTVPPMPTARDALAAATGANGVIYAIGGENGAGSALRTVEAYDPKANTCATLASMPAAEASLAATLGPQGQIYALGGGSGGGSVATVQVYDPSTDQWGFAPHMEQARDQLAAATGPHGRVYAIGGAYYGGPLNSVEAYTPVAPTPPGATCQLSGTQAQISTSANTWTSVAPALQPLMAVTSGPGGNIYAIPDGAVVFKEGQPPPSPPAQLVETYNPASNTWRQGRVPAPEPQAGGWASGPNGLLYMIGGGAQGSVSDIVQAYDPCTDTWSTAAPLPAAVGPGATVTGPDGRIYVIGGSTGGLKSSVFATASTNAVYAYDTLTNTWSTVAPFPVPIQGGDATAAVGPDGRIYVFVGGDVYAYTICTNSWALVATEPKNAPYDAGPTATTGADGRIYLMGGFENAYGDPAGEQATAFDVNTDTFSPVASMPHNRVGPFLAAGGDGRLYAVGNVFKYVPGAQGATYTGDPAVDAYTPDLAHPIHASAACGTLGINDTSVTAPATGTTTAHFTVTLSPAQAQSAAPGPPQGEVTTTTTPPLTTPTTTTTVTPPTAPATGAQAPVTVDYATADGTAKAGTDYVATNGTLVFAPGEKTKTVSVVVDGHPGPIPDKAFYVDLSNATLAVITRPQGTATISYPGSSVPPTTHNPPPNPTGQGPGSPPTGVGTQPVLTSGPVAHPTPAPSGAGHPSPSPTPSPAPAPVAQAAPQPGSVSQPAPHNVVHQPGIGGPASTPAPVPTPVAAFVGAPQIQAASPALAPESQGPPPPSSVSQAQPQSQTQSQTQSQSQAQSQAQAEAQAGSMAQRQRERQVELQQVSDASAPASALSDASTSLGGGLLATALALGLGLGWKRRTSHLPVPSRAITKSSPPRHGPPRPGPGARPRPRGPRPRGPR